MEETIRHVCNPKTAKGKDGGQNKKAIISAAQFKQIDEASRHGLTVEEKDKIDKMSLGELTSKYPYLNNVSPYQGYSSLNARERNYIISRYQQLLQKSRPKPPSILDDPSYAYYSAIAWTGIDPITGKKVSPAEIANAKLQIKVIVVTPIVQSVVAGWAFGKQQNPGTKSQKPYGPQPATGPLQPLKPYGPQPYSGSLQPLKPNQANGYTPPVGGGGPTDSITISGQTVTFGHGGRHLAKYNLNMFDVNEAAAKNVITQSISVGQTREFTIVVDGQTVLYKAHRLAYNKINIGTYFVPDRK